MENLPRNPNALEQLAALLTGGNKPNPLLGMMAAQNPLYTSDPTQTIDAARAFSQGMSSGAIGSIPGSGVVNAMGIQPRYDENWFIPAGTTQGPNIRENLQSGNYLDAGLQGLGLLGDAASVGAMASMVPKSAQRGGIRVYRGIVGEDPLLKGKGIAGEGIYTSTDPEYAAAYTRRGGQPVDGGAIFPMDASGKIATLEDIDKAKAILVSANQKNWTQNDLNKFLLDQGFSGRVGFRETDILMFEPDKLKPSFGKQ